MIKKGLYYCFAIISFCVPQEGYAKADTFLTGVVQDYETFDFVEGAQVDLVRGSKVQYTTQTDQSGFFSFENIEPSKYVLYVRAPGYDTMWMDVIPRSRRNIYEQIYVAKSRTGITGFITDANTNDPIENATVQFFLDGKYVTQGVTKTNGEYFAHTDEKPRNDRVIIRADGYRTREVHLDPNAKNPFDLNAEIVPSPKTTFSVKVIDDKTKQPISGVKITLVGEETNFATFAHTDVTGELSVSNLLPDSYIVIATASDYQDLETGLLIQGERNSFEELQMKSHPGFATVDVFDADKKSSILGAVVDIYKGNIQIASGQTDKRGNIQVKGLAPGRYTFVVRAGGYQIESQGIAIESGASTGSQFNLKQGGSALTGKMTDRRTGAPIPGARIQISHDLVNLATQYSDEQGNYAFSGLGKGNYILSALASGYQSIFQGVEIGEAGADRVEFALEKPPGRIVGNIKGPTGNAPISGAVVEALLGPVVMTTALSDSKGNFELSNLAPNNYSVVVSSPGYQRSVQDVAVTENGPTNIHFDTKTDAGILSGTVFDQDTRNKILGATVGIYLGNQLISSQETDEFGQYDFLHLPLGAYTVVATAHGYETQMQTADVLPQSLEQVRFSYTFTAAAGGSVDFALVEGGENIDVFVNDAISGNPISGAEIKLDSPPSFGVTDANGSAQITGLSFGERQTITASKPGYITDGRVVDIVPGGSGTLVLTLEPIPNGIQGLHCKCLKNKFLVDTDWIVDLSWQGSDSSNILGYKVFRNGEEIGFIGALESLNFRDSVVGRRTYKYSIQAVSLSGQSSALESIVIRP